MSYKYVLAGACALVVAGVLPSQEVSGVLPPAEITGEVSATLKTLPLQPGVLPPAEVAGEISGVVGVVPPVGKWLNPVPTRIEAEYYGYRLNKEPPIEVEVDPYGEDYSCIRVSGGTPGAGMVLFCADAPDAIPTDFGYFLVSPNCVTIPGVFEPDGGFEYPVNLGKRALCENSFYFQAIEVSNQPPGMELSWGLDVRYCEGNEVPLKLGYHAPSPAMQAILVRTVLEEVPILHTVLIRFEAASSYELKVENVLPVYGEDITRIYVSLTSDGGPVGPNKWHRAAVDVGKRYAPGYVEVWVSLDHGEFAPYLLGAVVETGYCS